MLLDIDPTDANACIDRIEELEKALVVAEDQLLFCLKGVAVEGHDMRWVRDALMKVREALRKK